MKHRPPPPVRLRSTNAPLLLMFGLRKRARRGSTTFLVERANYSYHRLHPNFSRREGTSAPEESAAPGGYI